MKEKIQICRCALLCALLFVVEAHADEKSSSTVSLVFEITETLSNSAALAAGFQPDDEQVAVGKVLKSLSPSNAEQHVEGDQQVVITPLRAQLKEEDLFLVALWFPYELEIEEQPVKPDAREWSFAVGLRYFGRLSKIELSGSGGRRRTYYVPYDSKSSLVPVSRNTDVSTIKSYTDAVLAYKRQEDANFRWTNSLLKALEQTD